MALSHQMFDAAVYLGVCDKIVPGLLIGALQFGHLPTVFVPAGPMTSGLSNSAKSKVREQAAQGLVGRPELLEAESAAYHGEGTCTFYGTANSNQMLLEAMGLHVPGTAFINPGEGVRQELTREAARTVLALGLNYADHAKELEFKAPEEPLVFIKGEGSLIGHRALTYRPPDVKFMHYECELAVVIGKTAKKVKRDDAYDFVGGYSVANDYAIRDYLENYYRPNLRVKNRDGGTVLGPWLVDAADVSDPHALALRTSVNGVVTQQGNTTDLITDIPALIEYLSSFMTLQAGDVILTGTPDGVVNVNVGDEVVTEIDGIGRLVNTIVADATFGR